MPALVRITGKARLFREDGFAQFHAEQRPCAAGEESRVFALFRDGEIGGSRVVPQRGNHFQLVLQIQFVRHFLRDISHDRAGRSNCGEQIFQAVRFEYFIAELVFARANQLRRACNRKFARLFARQEVDEQIGDKQRAIRIFQGEIVVFLHDDKLAERVELLECKPCFRKELVLRQNLFQHGDGVFRMRAAIMEGICKQLPVLSD